MSYLASKGISMENLVNQYTGRKFGELILYHLKLQSYEKIVQGIDELKSNVHPKLKATTEDFLKVIEHKFAKSKLLWATDCGKTLQIYVTSTKTEAKKYGLEVDDDYAFDIFNLIVLTLAARASFDGDFKRFIKKSIRKFWIF